MMSEDERSIANWLQQIGLPLVSAWVSEGRHRLEGVSRVTAALDPIDAPASRVRRYPDDHRRGRRGLRAPIRPSRRPI